jgi:hypothetical protein
MTTTQTTETDTYQDVNPEIEGRISLTLHNSCETAELLIETKLPNKDKVDYALVDVTKEELWEHIHNCLTIMEGMK